MEDFVIHFDFGKNTAHIWTSYAIAAVMLIMLAWYPRWSKKRLLKQLEKQQRREKLMQEG